MAEVIIVGLAELQAKLEKLALTLQQKGTRSAVKAGGQVLVDDAASRAPRDTGALANGMTMQVIGSETDASGATARVGPGKKQFYGNFVEKGTKFMRAEPYLLPAFENNRDRIMSAMIEDLREFIESFA